MAVLTKFTLVMIITYKTTQFFSPSYLLLLSNTCTIIIITIIIIIIIIIIIVLIIIIIHAQLKIKYTVRGPWPPTKYYYLEYFI